MIKKALINLSLAITFSFVSISAYPAEGSFTDVDESNVNYESVNQVVNQYNIMSGFPDKTFRGNATLDRYTYSAVILSTIQLLNRQMEEIEQQKIMDTNPPRNKDTLRFENVSDIKRDNHWAKEQAITLLKLGLIRTYSDDTFKGEQTVNHIGFAIGIGRLMSIIYDNAPPVLKRKWQKEVVNKVEAIKGIPKNSPIYEPLKLSIENNLIDLQDDFTAPVTRFEVADYITRLIVKLDELRKYVVFTKIG